MLKFKRNYVLTIESNIKPPLAPSIVTIQPPFTLEFDITRNQLTSANISSIKIINLNETTRNAILKDQYQFTDIRQLTLQAGYGPDPTNFPIIFTGFITQAWSVRRGTEFVTEIQSFDGGNAYNNARLTNFQLAAGTPYQNLIERLVKALAPFGVKRGKIARFPGNQPAAKSLRGNPIDALNELLGNQVFIDNGSINCIGLAEYLDNNPIVPVISAESGLLETPVREQQLLNFPVLFEPTLYIGQKIQLQSLTGPVYNQFYKIISLHHKGVISESVCGDAITDIGVYYSKNLTPVQT